MKRRKFIENICLATGCIFAVGGLVACEKEEVSSTKVDFSIDLNDVQYADLQQIGGFIIHQNVVIARLDASQYVAATVVCSHEGQRQIRWTGNQWVCSAHLAAFDIGGNGLNTHGAKGLTVYQTSLTGNILRVYQSS
ncbi:MAG: Rieske 2Fe-2S domain-containing protein [Thermoflexibacteraceae bacterium]